MIQLKISNHLRDCEGQLENHTELWFQNNKSSPRMTEPEHTKNHNLTTCDEEGTSNTSDMLWLTTIQIVKATPPPKTTGPQEK